MTKTVKILSLILAFSALLSLIGCGSDTVNEEYNGTSTEISTEAGSKKETELSTEKATETEKESLTDVTSPDGPFRQTRFYISAFKALPHSTGVSTEIFRKIVSANKEAGIGLIENAIMSRAEGLQAAEACELEGVPFLIQNITSERGFSGMGSSFPKVKPSLVKSVAGDMKDKHFCLGYFLWDEMGEENFADCRNICDMFREEDPGKLAYTLILPSYGPYKWDVSGEDFDKSSYARYVRGYIEAVDPDVVSFDYYAFDMHGGSKAELRNCTLWRDMGLIRKEALKAGKPFWFYFQSSDMGKGYEFTDSMRSVQMYTALAYGVKCLSHFDSMSSICDGVGRKTDSFEEVKQLNMRVQNIGDFLFDKESIALYHFGITEKNHARFYVDDETSSPYIETAPDNTVVGVFKGKDEKKYMLVATKDYKNDTEDTLSLKSGSFVAQMDIETGNMQQIGKEKSLTLSIPKGGCVLLEFED